MDQSLTPEWPVLVVDDEDLAIRAVAAGLRAGGITHILKCEDSREVMGILEKHEIGVILLDLTMPHISGEILLPRITEQYPNIPVVIVTGANDVETAVNCIKQGAFDYMVKPVEVQRLISGVKRAIELRELRTEYSALKKHLFSQELEHPEAFSSILTSSAAMQAIFRFAETIAGTDKPVLITGETGVGKELMARAIHALSRRPGPFVAVNVAGLEDTIFSDTLFGHKKGAFTGADDARSGLLEQASRGTLLLDEIGDLTATSQVKLLRLIQEREYFPLGADVPKTANARIVMATHCDLDGLCKTGKFRTDLYYRLQIHRIHIPPLRERLEDLPVLLAHFLGEAARVLGKTPLSPSRELTTLLCGYPFPGNIRELEAMVYAALGQCASGQSPVDTLRSHIQKVQAPKKEMPRPFEGQDAPVMISKDYFPTLKEATAYLVEEALKRSRNNQSMAAKLLGVTPSALNKRLKRSTEDDPAEDM